MDILIVEDHELTHNALLMLAHRMGMKPVGARSSAEAVRAVNRRLPQVLLTDWDLGEQYTGIDVANFVVLRNKRCKIIFCTGNCIVTLKQQVGHLTDCRFIHKPMSLQKFTETLSDVVSNDKG